MKFELHATRSPVSGLPRAMLSRAVFVVAALLTGTVAAAAGKFPGGFLKREGRPTMRETLTSRLTDRPIRPLFPEHYFDEVQVMANVLAIDGVNDPDVLSIIGASAALFIAPVPFNGPIGAVRVGMLDGQFILMPTMEQLKTSTLDLVVAGTESAVLMVESEADQLSEDVMLGAVVFGHDQGNVAINAIHLDGIPAFSYDDLWWERSLRSVANVTRQDVRDFLALVPAAGVRTQYETLPLERAPEALRRLEAGDVRGAFVLTL